ncbi:MAG: hypothetical protein IJO14_02965 [Clostridia bacterium]|nr:hypothetical protein [Clostridia bacterium]
MVCPKCGVEIKRFDLAPNCKKCGVHILYYTQEEDLARDAKKCELEFAKMRSFTEKIKLGFVKEKLALARMIIILIGAGFLFLPYASISAQLPFWSQKITISGWGAYQMFSDGILMQLLNILNADIAKETAVLLFANIALFVVTVLVLLGVFVTLLLGFLNLRKSSRVMTGLSIAAAVLCLAGIVLAFVLKGSVADSSLFTASVGAGYFGMIALLGALIAVNVLLYRKNPQPQIKEIDLERIEILKKVKNGEVSLDDLPLPVCYSEEEELARTQFIGASKKKDKKKKKGGDNNG